MAQLTLGHLTEAGAALVQQGKPALSVPFFELAVATARNDPACWSGLGQALRVCRRFGEAINALERAVSLEPTPRRLVSLACCYTDQERFAEAEPFILRALEIDPDCPEAKGLLGMISVDLWHQGRPDSTLERAIGLMREAELDGDENPSFGPAKVAALQILGRADEAMVAADRHLNRWPDDRETHVNRAWTWLWSGELDRGFQEYADWVVRRPDIAQAKMLEFPRWRRGDPNGQVVVWNAEGYGDLFMFARFFDQMYREGYDLKVVTDQNAQRLIGRCPGIDEAVIDDGEFTVERQAPLFDIPAAYIDTVPLWDGPYLSADQETIDKWAAYFAGWGTDYGEKLRVGLSWQGNPKQGNDPRRSFKPIEFEPLFRTDDHARFFWLQKGIGPDGKLPIVPFFDMGYQQADWLETAAVIQNLDLVITSDTAIAHLAGAIGKPVWLALNEPGCWRWQRDREDSPWYPSMRIFRQSKRGIWTDVFERIAAELSRQSADVPVAICGAG